MQPETPPVGSTRSGPLRNGNPRGNPNLAPRCGAKTRIGCPCQAPAMANGRCRMHGGASTGPRTAEGIERIRAARTKHGGYSQQSQEFLRRMDRFIADTRALLARLRAERTQAAPDPLPWEGIDVATEAITPCTVSRLPRRPKAQPGEVVSLAERRRTR